MKDLKETAEKWRAFNRRQDRIRARNMSSEEMFQAHQKEIESLKTYSPGMISYSLLTMESSALELKDMYQKSFEGMLEWIADGEPG